MPVKVKPVKVPSPLARDKSNDPLPQTFTVKRLEDMCEKVYKFATEQFRVALLSQFAFTMPDGEIIIVITHHLLETLLRKLEEAAPRVVPPENPT